MIWTCPTWLLAGSSCFLPLHWSTQPWPRWPEELPSHLSTAGPGHSVARSSFLKSSVIVAAIGWGWDLRQVPPPGNTACLMLCVQSLYLRGEKKRSCFCSQKNAAHIVRKGQPLEDWDETKLENGLLSLRNVTIPAFRTYLKPLEMSLNWELTCRVLQKPYLKWGEKFSSTFVFHLCFF